MYDMVFRDVAVLPKMSSVYHWVEGRAALTINVCFERPTVRRTALQFTHQISLLPMPPSLDFSNRQ